MSQVGRVSAGAVFTALLTLALSGCTTSCATERASPRPIAVGPGSQPAVPAAQPQDVLACAQPAEPTVEADPEAEPLTSPADLVAASEMWTAFERNPKKTGNRFEEEGSWAETFYRFYGEAMGRTNLLRFWSFHEDGGMECWTRNQYEVGCSFRSGFVTTGAFDNSEMTLTRVTYGTREAEVCSSFQSEVREHNGRPDEVNGGLMRWAHDNGRTSVYVPTGRRGCYLMYGERVYE